MKALMLIALVSLSLTTQAGFFDRKITITDLANASDRAAEAKKLAQQGFDDVVWQFLKENHKINSPVDLFQFIRANRTKFENQNQEESFEFLMAVVEDKGGISKYHGLPLEDINFQIISVSEYRKGFIVKLNLNTNGCYSVYYDVDLLIEKDKLEVTKEKSISRQKISQSEFPCMG